MKQLHIKMNLKDAKIKSIETVCDIADFKTVLDDLKNFASYQDVIAEEVQAIDTEAAVENEIETELRKIENEHCLNADICSIQNKAQLNELISEINEAYANLIIARSKAAQIHNNKLLTEAEHIKSKLLYTKSYISERAKVCNKLSNIVATINKCKGIIVEINAPFDCIKVLDGVIFDLDGIKSNIKETTYSDLKDEIERLKELNNSKVSYLKTINVIN